MTGDSATCNLIGTFAMFIGVPWKLARTRNWVLRKRKEQKSHAAARTRVARPVDLERYITPTDHGPPRCYRSPLSVTTSGRWIL